MNWFAPTCSAKAVCSSWSTNYGRQWADLDVYDFKPTFRDSFWGRHNKGCCSGYNPAIQSVAYPCCKDTTITKPFCILVAGRCDCRRGLGRRRLLRKIGKFSITQPSIAGCSRFAVKCEPALKIWTNGLAQSSNIYGMCPCTSHSSLSYTILYFTPCSSEHELTDFHTKDLKIYKLVFIP